MANMMDLLLAVEMVMNKTLVMTRIFTWQNRNQKQKLKRDKANTKAQKSGKKMFIEMRAEKIQI